MPKVTVLMPVYNTKEEYLRETIDSVLTQTFTDFEFLIINDASTDKRVREVVLSYADDRIVYVENEKNLGISESSNKGISLAKGEYIFLFIKNVFHKQPDIFLLVFPRQIAPEIPEEKIALVNLS